MIVEDIGGLNQTHCSISIWKHELELPYTVVLPFFIWVCIEILKKALSCMTFMKLYLFAHISNTAENWKSKGDWAIVTGATDGIGKAFAFAFAKVGLNVMLISRSSTKLQTIASEITTKWKVNVKTLQADFQETDIYENIRMEVCDLDIAVLVNNVGITYETACVFHKESNWIFPSLHVNCASMAMMSHMVLPQIKSKGRGSIINVSSMLSDYGYTHGTTYAASKAFVSRLSRDLNRSYGYTGVTVQTLLPGSVSTKMLRRFSPNNLSHFLMSFLAPTAEDYVNWALKTHGLAAECYGHPKHAIQAGILMFTPNFFMDFLCGNS